MRLTVRTNLAMRALMFCAVNAGRTVRKSDIAEACNASENHLGHVIHMLSQTGFIETTRGRHGGIRLATPPEAISVGKVFRIFEANVPFAECFAGADNHCPISSFCRMRDSLSVALEAFYETLDGITLKDLVKDNTGLQSILFMEET